MDPGVGRRAKNGKALSQSGGNIFMVLCVEELLDDLDGDSSARNADMSKSMASQGA